MKVLKLTSDQFRLWRDNKNNYREKLIEETGRLYGDAQIRRPNGTILKMVKAGPRIITNQAFVAARDCACRDWRRPNGASYSKDEHHPECLEGKRWAAARAGKPIEPSTAPIINGVPTKIVELPTGQSGISTVQSQGEVISPQACNQCRDWAMPDGGKRPPDKHHPLCQYREAWEFQQKPATVVAPPDVVEANAEVITSTPAPAPSARVVEPKDCIDCKDWAWPTGGERPKDRHHPICPHEGPWLQATTRPKLVNIQTGDVLKLATANEISSAVETFRETGVMTVELDGTLYQLLNYEPPSETERPPATEPSSGPFLGGRFESPPTEAKADADSNYAVTPSKHKPRRGKRAS